MSARLSTRGYRQRGLYPLWRYGAKGDGSADDTAAVQAAVDAAAASGGGEVLAPPGDYLIAGPMRTLNGVSGQVLLPSTPRDAGADAPMCKIRFRGTAPCSPMMWDYVTSGMARAPSNAVATFLSSGHQGSSGALFAAPPVTSSVFLPGGFESAVEVGFEDVQLLTYRDPAMHCLDLRAALCMELEGVNIGGDTFYYGAQAPYGLPANGGIGVYCPLTGNGAVVTARRVSVTGYTRGFYAFEHFVGDAINLNACANGIAFGQTGHPMQFSGQILACKNAMDFSLAPQASQQYPKVIGTRVTIEQPSGGPLAGGYDVYDPNISAAGTLNIHKGGGGMVLSLTTFIGTGSQSNPNLTIVPIGSTYGL